MKVYQAINAVQADLAKVGISKDRKNEHQGYKFRGIDEIYGAVAPLLAKHGLVILPRATERTVSEQESKNGGKLFYITVRVEFDFVSAEDGSKHTACMYGEAMDSGDKATNKAMSAAYKYACLQAFCIPTEGDNDADSQTHEVVSKTDQPLSKEELALVENYHAEVITRLKEHGATNTMAYIESLGLDPEMKIHLWGKLHSRDRSALKKVLDARKQPETK